MTQPRTEAWKRAFALRAWYRYVAEFPDLRHDLEAKADYLWCCVASLAD